MHYISTLIVVLALFIAKELIASSYSEINVQNVDGICKSDEDVFNQGNLFDLVAAKDVFVADCYSVQPNIQILGTDGVVRNRVLDIGNRFQLLSVSSGGEHALFAVQNGETFIGQTVVNISSWEQNHYHENIDEFIWEYITADSTKNILTKQENGKIVLLDMSENLIEELQGEVRFGGNTLQLQEPESWAEYDLFPIAISPDGTEALISVRNGIISVALAVIKRNTNGIWNQSDVMVAQAAQGEEQQISARFWGPVYSNGQGGLAGVVNYFDTDTSGLTTFVEEDFLLLNGRFQELPGDASYNVSPAGYSSYKAGGAIGGESSGDYKLWSGDVFSSWSEASQGGQTIFAPTRAFYKDGVLYSIGEEIVLERPNSVNRSLPSRWIMAKYDDGSNMDESPDGNGNTVTGNEDTGSNDQTIQDDSINQENVDTSASENTDTGGGGAVNIGILFFMFGICVFRDDRRRRYHLL